MGLEYVKARQLALRRGKQFVTWDNDNRLISSPAYPDAFDGEDEPDLFGASEVKITRPLSAPGSPRERSGLMTPGDFGSLQEGREGLSTEDYIAWKLP
jgi:glycogen(starch) synthase